MVSKDPETLSDGKPLFKKIIDYRKEKIPESLLVTEVITELPQHQKTPGK